jgi:hypothetical protein
MQTEYGDHEYTGFEDSFLNVNQLLDKRYSIELGYQCLNCGKKKDFRQGFVMTVLF